MTKNIKNKPIITIEEKINRLYTILSATNTTLESLSTNTTNFEKIIDTLEKRFKEIDVDEITDEQTKNSYLECIKLKTMIIEHIQQNKTKNDKPILHHTENTTITDNSSNATTSNKLVKKEETSGNIKIHSKSVTLNIPGGKLKITKLSIPLKKSTPAKKSDFDDYNFILGKKQSHNSYTQYKVERHEKKNGQYYITENIVYGYIDFDKISSTKKSSISDTTEYRRRIVDDLLSAKSIEKSYECGIGYVGELVPNDLGSYKKVLKTNNNLDSQIQKLNFEKNSVIISINNSKNINKMRILKIGTVEHKGITKKSKMEQYAIITFDKNYNNYRYRIVYGNLDFQKLKTLEQYITNPDSINSEKYKNGIDLNDLKKYKDSIFTILSQNPGSSTYICSKKLTPGYYTPVTCSHFNSYLNTQSHTLSTSKNIDIPV